MLEKTVRYSGIVMCFARVRRAELERLGQRHLPVGELCHALPIFRQGHDERLKRLAAHRATFAQTTPFELLVLASLYAFERLGPRGMASPHREEGVQSEDQDAWQAINDVFL
ncbi:MAG: hypothetical protein EOP82_04610 [Variovorax sp.]|nr:MAG: hypothetical protein EOP82_04610 [Variovorax sp.]